MSLSLPEQTTGAGHAFAQLIRAQQSIGQITVGENQKKFLSAISANTVVNAELRAQSPADFPERLIAKKMAEGVVHTLETVDVAKDHSHRLVLPARAPIPAEAWRESLHDSSIQ
jgi:hypothetical protein